MDTSDCGSCAPSESDFEYEGQSDADFNEPAFENDEDNDAMVIEPPEVRKLPYVSMTRNDVADRQNRCINEACNLLDVTREEAFVLLRVHTWDVNRLQEAWFDNEQKVRTRCGLGGRGQPCNASSSSSVPIMTSGGNCPICMTAVANMVSLDCGHSFCEDCWRQYLQTQVDDGKSAMQTSCPQHKCGRSVPVDFFRRYLQSDALRLQKYEEWYIRSYVDDNPNVKWCPNPQGCGNACEYQGIDPIEIRCLCGFMHCWVCSEEAHRPASCKTVSDWNVKNHAESENISWIRANTKKCPKCHRAIEKNQGCNHMVCSKAGGCGHEFCWLCLGEWSTHGTSTGGYYQCNIYDKQAKEGKHAEEEKSRTAAKHALDKYMFYFERFMDHDRSMKLTVKQEVEIESHVQKLHDSHGFEIVELQFLYEALKQVRTCRRVLKWTYVYGYYLPAEAGAAKNLFEFLQKNLEEKTDNLHELLEKKLDEYIPKEGKEDSSVSPDDNVKERFMNFRSHVTNFSTVTKKFMQEILDGLRDEGTLTDMANSVDARM